jgi:hypothetical protein
MTRSLHRALAVFLASALIVNPAAATVQPNHLAPDLTVNSEHLLFQVQVVSPGAIFSNQVLQKVSTVPFQIRKSVGHGAKGRPNGRLRRYATAALVSGVLAAMLGTAALGPQKMLDDFREARLLHIEKARQQVLLNELGLFLSAVNPEGTPTRLGFAGESWEASRGIANLLLIPELEAIKKGKLSDAESEQLKARLEPGTETANRSFILEIQQRLQRNPYTLINRNVEGVIDGVVFIALVHSDHPDDLPLTWDEMSHLHQRHLQEGLTPNHMVDFLFSGGDSRQRARAMIIASAQLKRAINKAHRAGHRLFKDLHLENEVYPYSTPRGLPQYPKLRPDIYWDLLDRPDITEQDYYEMLRSPKYALSADELKEQFNELDFSQGTMTVKDPALSLHRYFTRGHENALEPILRDGASLVKFIPNAFPKKWAFNHKTGKWEFMDTTGRGYAALLQYIVYDDEEEVPVPAANRLRNRIQTVVDSMKNSRDSSNGQTPSLADLRREYIRRVIPRPKPKANDKAIGQVVARYVNGFGVVPLLLAFALPAKVTLSASPLSLIRRYPGISLLELNRRITPHDGENVMGNQEVYLRGFVDLHWMKIEGPDENPTYTLTPLGRQVLEVAESKSGRTALKEVGDAYEHFQHYYEYFRGSRLDEAEAALAQYQRLIALSTKKGRRWGIPMYRGREEAVGELRSALDGAIVSPTIVALSLPEHQRSENLLKVIRHPFFEQGNPVIDPAVVRGWVHREFLSAAFDLLSSQKPSGMTLGVRNGDKFEFTEEGMDFMLRRGSFGVPESYVKGLQPRTMEDLILDTGNPDAAHVLTYSHFDHLVNGWGAAMANGVFHPAILEVVLNLAENGYRGLMEWAAGSGLIGLSMALALRGWSEIRDQHERLQPNGLHTFHLIGSDVTPTALSKIEDLFNTEIDGISGISYNVVHGDITKAAQVTREIKTKLGIDVTDRYMHLFMFAFEERDSGDETDRLPERVLNAESKPNRRKALRNYLERLGALKKDEVLPQGEALVDLVANQYHTPRSNRGKRVLPRAAASEFIGFIEQLNLELLITMDVIRPSLAELENNPVGFSFIYGVIHQLKEKIMTSGEGGLSYVLGGYWPEVEIPFPKVGAPLAKLSVLRRISEEAA